ncbi:MAG: DUF2851 family protein [Rikenellaceae bacterium]
MAKFEQALLNGELTTEQKDDLLNYLMHKAVGYHCGTYIHFLSAIEQVQLYQELETERIVDKYNYISATYKSRGHDWDQTLFLLMMRALSDKYHKREFMELADCVGYKTLAFERDNIENLEAILIVASGLIGTLPIDPFIDSIHKRGAHLIHKYGLRTMHIDDWKRPRLPVSFAIITRLLQMTQLIYNNEFLFNKVISCAKRDDCLTLFKMGVRKEWLGYFKGVKGLNVGVDKRDILGINVVIPMLYTYGRYTQYDPYFDAAGNLNETIPAERNYFITRWREKGLTPTVAYESQALIQLASVYCRQSTEHKKARKEGEYIESRCKECPVYKHMISRASALFRCPAFINA